MYGTLISACTVHWSTTWMPIPILHDMPTNCMNADCTLELCVQTLLPSFLKTPILILYQSPWGGPNAHSSNSSSQYGACTAHLLVWSSHVLRGMSQDQWSAHCVGQDQDSSGSSQIYWTCSGIITMSCGHWMYLQWRNQAAASSGVTSKTVLCKRDWTSQTWSGSLIAAVIWSRM